MHQLAGQSIGCNLLVTEGYQITAVADGAAGLRELQGSSFDLLILDLRMPVMDGREMRTRHSRRAATTCR